MAKYTIEIGQDGNLVTPELTEEMIAESRPEDRKVANEPKKYTDILKALVEAQRGNVTDKEFAAIVG